MVENGDFWGNEFLVREVDLGSAYSEEDANSEAEGSSNASSDAASNALSDDEMADNLASDDVASDALNGMVRMMRTMMGSMKAYRKVELVCRWMKQATSRKLRTNSH